MVESSFSAVSRPITNNLQLGPLDDFACRQLDRIGAPNRSPGRKDGEHLRSEPEGSGLERETTPPTRHERYDGDSERAESPASNQVAIQHGQRSRWQTVLVEAGGLGAAVSEESLKSLRYCLQWLVVRPSSTSNRPSCQCQLTRVAASTVRYGSPRSPNFDIARFHPVTPCPQPFSSSRIRKPLLSRSYGLERSRRSFSFCPSLTNQARRRRNDPQSRRSRLEVCRSGAAGTGEELRQTEYHGTSSQVGECDRESRNGRGRWEPPNGKTRE